MQLAKSFEPRDIEARWYPIWESRGYFSSRPDHERPAYCIQLPPPNVTGTLHMGHAFQQTLMDALIRYHACAVSTPTGWSGPITPASPRRSWSSASWSSRARPGTIWGREKFIERVWEWKSQSGSTIIRQMRRLGASANWEYADTEGQRAGYFTMDAKMSRAVIEVSCACTSRA